MCCILKIRKLRLRESQYIKGLCLVTGRTMTETQVGLCIKLWHVFPRLHTVVSLAFCLYLSVSVLGPNKNLPLYLISKK